VTRGFAERDRVLDDVEHRRFVFHRIEDESGVSGVGKVAWGCAFPDGTAAVRWNTKHRSTAVYSSMEDVEVIHGHDGKTQIVWLDPERGAPMVRWEYRSSTNLNVAELNERGREGWELVAVSQGHFFLKRTLGGNDGE
jgi:L-alanine-DL-glutamate epimerase-like enolase superfamily enzyme